jgi:hypothetical protein
MGSAAAQQALLPPELRLIEAVRSGLTQAEACGLHPAKGHFNQAPV